MCLQYKSFENTEGKGEIAHNEQFPLFPQCFLPDWISFCHFHQIWNCHLQSLSVWKSLKFVIWERVKKNFRLFDPGIVRNIVRKIASEVDFLLWNRGCWLTPDYKIFWSGLNCKHLQAEIGLYKQFLFFPQSFQKASFQDLSEGVIVLEWVLSV